MFSLLSDYALEEDGVVFGAALSEDCRQVRHIAVETKEELCKLRGSKYVQSSIGRIYQDVKGFLEAGRTVLFTGTPCQVEGLYGYLGKNYEKLYTADLICHGVPSQYVWNKYLDYQEELEGSRVKRVSFRNKISGWEKFSMLLEFSNGYKYVKSLDEDLYLRAFLNNADLRSCCYHCDFKTLERKSDFTIADLWGVDEMCPEWNDDQGISLLILHSEKAQKVLDKIGPNARTQRIDIHSAIMHNPMAIESMTAHPKRKQFIRDMDRLPFDELVKRYGTTPFSMHRTIGNLLRRVGLK